MSVIALVLVWPAGVVAQSQGLYISGGISVVLPRDLLFEGIGINTEARFDPGGAISLAIGSTLGEDWRAEGEIGYLSADVDRVSGAENSNGKVNAAVFIVNGYRDFRIDANWTPYIGVGVGAMRLEFEGVSPVGGSRIDDDAWTVAAQGIAGIGYRIDDQFGVYTDYRFLAVAHPDFTTDAGTTVEGEYSEHRITVGLRWSFGGPAPEARPERRAERRPIPRKAPMRTRMTAADKTPMAAPDKTPMAAPAKTPEPRPAAKTAQAPDPVKQAEVARRFVLFFGWDRSKLTEEARAIVQDAAEASAQVPITAIEAIGHADRSGPDRYNMALSQRRAEAVKAELVRLGVPDKDIVIVHKGESEPLVATADGKRELRNRRVEIILK